MSLEEMATEIRLLSDELFQARQAAHRIEVRLSQARYNYDQAQREAFAYNKASAMVEDLTIAEQKALLAHLLKTRNNH